MNYIYVDTRDYDFSKIDKVLDYVKSHNIDNFVFLVNDIRSIDYLRNKGIKAVNVDAFFDVVNIVTYEDYLYYYTDEDATFLQGQPATRIE
ncbi:MAG: hypothetical protein GXO40_06310 [Epsilonproteobacteria bacterium]|nr:hypothetical protein [Campylobacterota bacterium]